MIRIGFLAAWALASAAPVLAQEVAPATPDFRSMSDEELRSQTQALAKKSFDAPCAIGVPYMAERYRRSGAEFEMGHLYMQVLCAYEQADAELGLKLVRQFEGKFDGPGLGRIALYFAVDLEDGEEVLKRMRQVEPEGFLQSMPVEQLAWAVRTVVRDGQGDQLDEYFYQLAGKSSFDRFDRVGQSLVASRAIQHAARVKDLARVERLLQYDNGPDDVLGMLVDRTFEPAWPLIEEFAGDHLQRVSDNYVKSQAEYLADKPEDRDRLSSYSYALLFAGRFQEAVEVARSWLPVDGSLQGLQEGNAWALNMEAYALDALGRSEEADEVLDKLATLPADENPWVVNFVINRASRLVDHGRWEEGLAATELARTVAEKHGSMYAKMLIAQARACALHELGRTNEAEAEAEFLTRNFNESGSVASLGLLCLGRREEVERMIARAMDDSVVRDSLLGELQEDRFNLFPGTSVLPSVRDVILANDDLREEALKYVRILPENLVPIAYLRRQEIALAKGSPAGS